MEKINKDLPIYKLFIGDELIDGITGMGIVLFPAIEQDFIYLTKHIKDENNFMLSNINEEKGLIISPALIPNKKIYRKLYEGDPGYYIVFDKETIKKASELFFKNSKHTSVSEQHETPINGLYAVESWIVENEYDKLITEYGYKKEDISVGTWALSYKIENEEVKEKIRNGELRGISIESIFIKKLDLKLNKQHRVINILEKNNYIFKYNEKITNVDILNEQNKVIDILEKNDFKF